MIVPEAHVSIQSVIGETAVSYLSDWWQSELERCLWRAAVQLQLLLLGLALIHVDGAAVLRH
jgi:hypothetical protein